MSIAKDQLRQIISENNITTVPDIYAFFKDSFKDMLQELLEAELDTSIGYPKNDKCDAKTDNKRNGYSTKAVRVNMGSFPLKSQGIAGY